MKKIVKFYLSILFYYSGLLHIFKFWNKLRGKRLTILTFHQVTKTNSESRVNGLPTISMTDENFELLIKFLRHHYKIISAQDYLKSIQNRETLAHNSLILTFDDCYKDIIKFALPVLKKLGLPVIMFVPTGTIDEEGFFWWDVFYYLITDNKSIEIDLNEKTEQSVKHFLKWLALVNSEIPSNKIRAMAEFIEALQKSPEEIRTKVVQHIFSSFNNRHHQQHQVPEIMQWKDVKILQETGFEIGSHTVSHRFLSTVPDEDVFTELIDSKKRLEKLLTGSINCFAYPGGKYSDKAVELVEQAGYLCAFTTDAGINSGDENRFQLKRINMWDGMVTNYRGKFSRSLTALHLFLNK